MNIIKSETVLQKKCCNYETEMVESTCSIGRFGKESQLMNETPGSLLSNLRRVRQLSLRELASKVDVSHSMLSRLENDKIPMSYMSAVKLSRYFHVGLKRFLRCLK